MIKIKQHTRKRKNGASVVRSHMKKSKKREVKSQIKSDTSYLKNMGKDGLHSKGLLNARKKFPKTGAIRSAIANNSTVYTRGGGMREPFRKSHDAYGVPKTKRKAKMPL